MKALIIDDEKRTRQLIAKMIDSYNLDIECFPVGENVQTGLKAIEEIKPDIVFLDIQMPDGTGFDLLNSVANKDFEVVFITAYEEFALKAIKFSALDYILKPVDSDELRLAVEKALNNVDRNFEKPQLEALNQNIQSNEIKRLVLKTHESVYVVDVDNIIRCEADRNYTSFYLLEGKKILVSRTLKDYEILLKGNDFFRVQQSHLINLKYVERYDKKDGGSVIMKDGSTIPLSPAKKDEFFKILEGN